MHGSDGVVSEYSRHGENDDKNRLPRKTRLIETAALEKEKRKGKEPLR
jgi:hypothetical protein